MKNYQVVWDNRAKESLRAILHYIQEESPSAGRKVRVGILKLTASLKKMPERFSVEFYLQHKGKDYRSVIKWSYKIIYSVSEDQVRIVEIIHTSRNTTAIEAID
jgi:plasmid stabilization system protein ParE